MKGLLVTIVDVLGIFVPGFLLLMGILIFPPLANDLFEHWPTCAAWLEVVRNNLAVIGVLSAITAYVFGFLIRLCSITILQSLTFHLWAVKLKRRARRLERSFVEALSDKALCQGIKAETKSRSRFEVTYLAPYFSFAKRVIQNGNQSLWAGTERLEAEIRFAAGTFIPLLVFVCDGLWIATFTGYFLAAVSGVGAFVILATFPKRRIREVIHVYHMALIVLKYPSTLQTSSGDA